MCDICNDTGVVTGYTLDEGRMVPDIDEKCVCKLEAEADHFHANEEDHYQQLVAE